jgi:hypothetical protein
MRKMHGILLAAVVLLMLSGCTLFGAGPESPTPGATIEIIPDVTSVPTGEAPPTPVPTADPGVGGGGAGTAGPGDVLFVRDGQVWAIRQDGTGERALTNTAFDSRIEYPALSPSGRYLAFTVNSRELDVLDLQAGQMTTVDSSEFGAVGPLTWALDNDELFYQKIVSDATTMIPVTSSIFWVSMPDNVTPTLVIESAVDTEAYVYPGPPIGDNILVQEIFPGQADLGDWYLFPIAGGDAIVTVAPGYSYWDISPDGKSMLLFRRSDQQAGVDASVPLHIAQLDPLQGALGTIQLSPTDESAAYTYAAFGPDGVAILALRRESGAADSVIHLGYLLPSAEGPYVVTAIRMPDNAPVSAFSWVDADTAVVSTVAPPDPEDPDAVPSGKLWLVDLTTGTATPLTTGDSPVAIPAP